MKNEQTPVQPQPATSQQPAPTPVSYVDTSPRNFLAIMLLAMFAGPYGLARWYRGDDSGKIRFWVAIGCSVCIIVPFLNIVAVLGLLVFHVWGIVDFFLLSGTTTDVNNTPYVASSRDITWVNNLKIAYIVLLVLQALVIVLGLILAVAGFFTYGNIVHTGPSFRGSFSF